MLKISSDGEDQRVKESEDNAMEWGGAMGYWGRGPPNPLGLTTGFSSLAWNQSLGKIDEGNRRDLVKIYP